MNIFDSYIDAGQELSQAEKAEYYVALIEYMAYGREPTFKRQGSKAVFVAIRPSLDVGKKRSESGKKGMASRYQNGELLPNKTGNKTENSPLTKGKSKGNKEDTPNGVSKKAPPFEAPTAEEVGAYAESQGIAIDAARFVDFYASNGWMVGRVPMADWRAAARRWGERAAPAEPRAKPRRCPKCGAQISKSTQTGKWECGACGGTYGRLP